MPPVRLKLALSVVVLSPRSTVIPPLPWAEATLKEYAPGRADVRLPEPAEEDAQHRVGVGGGADRGARVGAHPLLVDDDRRRQPVEHVDVGPRQRRHEALHERAVGLVDQPLRLRGDRAEHERALARARDAGEHGQPALRDLDADVLEVVHARAVHADQVVAVGGVGCDARALAGGHRSCSSPRTLPSGSVTVATRRPPPTSCAGSLTVAPGAGHLGQLRLDVRHVPVGHRRGHALRAAARHEPDVLALDVEADVVRRVGLRRDAEQRGVHRLGRRQVGHGMQHGLDSLGGHHHSSSRGSLRPGCLVRAKDERDARESTPPPEYR